jgi:hypothetical protein
VDTATQGNWVGTYGSAGYILNGFNLSAVGYNPNPPSPSADAFSLPGYVSSYSYGSGAGQYMWALNTPDPRALLDPSSTYRNAASAFTLPGTPTGSFALTLNGQSADFVLSIYALDWDNNLRNESITVAAGAASATQSISGFSGGDWLNFHVVASAGETVTVSSNISQNAVISALAFESVPEPCAVVALSGLCGMGLLGLVWRRRK